MSIQRFTDQSRRPLPHLLGVSFTIHKWCNLHTDLILSPECRHMRLSRSIVKQWITIFFLWQDSHVFSCFWKNRACADYDSINYALLIEIQYLCMHVELKYFNSYYFPCENGFHLNSIKTMLKSLLTCPPLWMLRNNLIAAVLDGSLYPAVLFTSAA